MERKRELTKILLAESFKELLIKGSFDKITIKMITDQAGVIRPTFYNYFQDKYEVMEWLLETEVFQHIREMTEDGMERPEKGRIVIDGVTLFDAGKKIFLKPQKRKVGYLFQNYALFPNMTVEQNIGIGFTRTTLSDAPSPCTSAGYRRICTYGFLRLVMLIISRTAAPVGAVTTPTVRTYFGIGFLYSGANIPISSSSFLSFINFS